MRVKVGLMVSVVLIVFGIYIFSANLNNEKIIDILKLSHFSTEVIDNLLSNISQTPFFILMSTKQGTTTYAMAFTTRTYDDPQEIGYIQNACFDSAIYYSIEPFTMSIIKSMIYDPKYKELLITYITQKVLFARIEKFRYEKMGTYERYVYSIVEYDNTNIYNFNLTFDDIKEGFARFLYEEAFTDLTNKEFQDSFALFQDLYSLNSQYSNDALSFMAFIKVEKGDFESAQTYLKMINVLDLTINGLIICGRIYNYLGYYSLASYFYSEVLKKDPNNSEAKAYFASLDKMRNQESKSFLEGIKIGK